MCVEASRIRYDDLTENHSGESSAVIRERVCRAREIQKERYKETDIKINAMLKSDDLKRFCVLGKEENELMERAYSVMGLTARAYHRVLKTARTIADMDGKRMISVKHLREALGYRMIDRKYWG